VLQRVAVCCSVFSCSVLQRVLQCVDRDTLNWMILKRRGGGEVTQTGECVAVCCRVLQFVAPWI